MFVRDTKKKREDEITSQSWMQIPQLFRIVCMLSSAALTGYPAILRVVSKILLDLVERSLVELRGDSVGRKCYSHANREVDCEWHQILCRVDEAFEQGKPVGSFIPRLDGSSPCQNGMS